MTYSYVVEFPEGTPGARRNANGKCVEVGVHPSRMVAVPREDAVLVPRGTKAVACLQLGVAAVMDAAAAPAEKAKTSSYRQTSSGKGGGDKKKKQAADGDGRRLDRAHSHAEGRGGGGRVGDDRCQHCCQRVRRHSGGGSNGHVDDDRT